MQKLYYGLIVLTITLCQVSYAKADVTIGIGLPNVSIGINLPVFPELVMVPGYPVYYAPQMAANYFFYDGMYWVYQEDNWYASSWYNGPWEFVDSNSVPLYILRVPVSYYRQPPVYFRGWQSNAPPRWGQHWGRGWEQQHSGWNKWQRSSAPAPAPLPVYQRKYSGDRYPHVEQQNTLHNQSYRYQPRDKNVQKHIKQVEQKAPAAAQRKKQEEPSVKSQKQHEPVRVAPLQQGAPATPKTQPPQRGGEHVQKSLPVRTQPQQRPQSAPEHQKQQPQVQQQKQQPQVQQQRQQPAQAQQKQQPHVQQKPVQEQKKQQPATLKHEPGQNKDEERGRGRNL